MACTCVLVRAAAALLQPGKLVANTDVRADVLSQLEVACKAAPAQGDSKAAKKQRRDVWWVCVQVAG